MSEYNNEEALLIQDTKNLVNETETALLSIQKEVVETQNNVSNNLVKAGNGAKEDILFNRDLNETQ